MFGVLFLFTSDLIKNIQCCNIWVLLKTFHGKDDFVCWKITMLDAPKLIFSFCYPMIIKLFFSKTFLFSFHVCLIQAYFIFGFHVCCVQAYFVFKFCVYFCYKLLYCLIDSVSLLRSFASSLEMHVLWKLFLYICFFEEKMFFQKTKFQRYELYSVI